MSATIRDLAHRVVWGWVQQQRARNVLTADQFPIAEVDRLVDGVEAGMLGVYESGKQDAQCVRPECGEVAQLEPEAPAPKKRTRKAKA